MSLTSTRLLLAVSVLACLLPNFEVHSYVIEDLLGSPSEIVKQEFEKGAGKQHEASAHSSQGEKGAKAYAAHHQAQQGAQGHHDKAGAQKHYAEQGGNKKGHHHQDGYYAQHHQGHKGAQGHHFVDQGSYAKGHSTKGHHNVHKLDEFKKNKDFYDEDHDEAFKEKHGGFEAKKGFNSGSHAKGGHSSGGHEASAYGKVGKFEKGAHNFQDAGHKKAQGHEGHYQDEAEFGKKGGQEQFKKWGFSQQDESKH